MKGIDELQLRRALRANQFGVLYQPQFDWAGATRGYEALVRWNHPRRGAVAPSAFLRSIEDAGLLPELTEHVVAIVCGDARALRAGPGRPVWINVSERQLLDPALGDIFLRAIQHARLPQGTLGVDVGAWNRDPADAAVAEAVAALRVRGLLVTVEHVARANRAAAEVDAIAVDVSRAVARDGALQLTEYLQGSFEAAEACGATLVGQRVEHSEQEEVMRQVGCEVLQGYWLARPRPLYAVTPGRRVSERVEHDASAFFVG